MTFRNQQLIAKTCSKQIKRGRRPHISELKNQLIFCFVIWVCLFGLVFSAQADLDIARYRVFALKNISAEDGRGFLDELQMGTVSQLPGSNTLLVTASPEDLIKASSILEMLDSDSNKKFAVKQIAAEAELGNLLSIEKIAEKIAAGENGIAVSIGTFLAPPDRNLQQKAIIDIHNGKVVVVAPQDLIDKIITAATGQQKNAVVEIDELNVDAVDLMADELQREYDTTPLNESDSDELFSKLLDSLAETEKELDEAEKTIKNETKKIETAAKQDEIGKTKTDKKEVVKKPEPVLQTKKSEPIEKPQRSVTVDIVPKKPEQKTKVWLYETETVSAADEMLELDLPEKLNIEDLLSLVGEYLGLDYMYDSAKVKGDVTLRLRGPIKVRDLYPLLESVLKFKNFVMTRKGNLVVIVPSAEVLDIDPILQGDGDKVKLGDVIITRIFELKYISVASAQNLLTGMKLGVNITPIAESGTLVVTGYAYRMERIEELLDMIDKSGELKQFRFRQLEYTMAKTLAPKIKQLSEQLGTVSVTIAAAKPAAKSKRGRRTTTPATKASSGSKKRTVYLDADERTNRILMIGLAEQLEVVDGLIDTLDVQQQDLRIMRLYEIQYVGAEEVKSKLQELGIISGSGRRTTTPGRKGQPATTTTQDAPTEEPQVVIVESTNSLLVNATSEQHLKIIEIISYVDSETLEQAIPYEIYALENQNPTDLAAVLDQLIQEVVKDKEGKIQQVVKKQEDIIIVADENTFSLIVYANKKNQEWIKKLIRKLDRRRPQVLIDVALVEITRDDEFAYDLNIIANATKVVTGNLAITDVGTGAITGLPIAASTGNGLEFGWNLGDPSGRIQGFYSDDKIQALFTAMDKKNYGRVLAQPKVLVNDNEEGVIKTTEKTYVGEETQSWPGDGTTPVTTVKWTPYEAKIELMITPNISEGDLLRLEINMLREDFEKSTDGSPPDYATSNIDTIVTVPDGSTIILGGLTKLKQKKGGNKVPLLGDAPLIGGLFRSVANNDESSKLYIFVKANILRPDEGDKGLEQLKKISARNKAAFEKAERQFQNREDWPGIEPEPLDPLKVLEAN